MTDRAKTTDPAPARARGTGGGRDEGDEFARIPRARTRHPVLALGAAALAFFLVAHVRHELRYALSSGEPLDLGDARVTFAPNLTVSDIDNRYVRVRGTPDRESGLDVDTKGSWTFSQFFRVLGTGDRLFVHRRDSPLPAEAAEDDVFEGRLVRFGELPFEDAVRAFFSKHVVATHFFAVETLRAALAAGPGGPRTLRDRAGDPVTLAPDSLLAIDVSRPGEVRVGLPRDRFVDAAAARAEIERRGGKIVADKGLVRVEARGAAAAGPLSVGGDTPPVERWTFVARFEGPGRDAALSALGDLDRKVEIRDARETIDARLSELTAADDGLHLPERATVRPGGARPLTPSERLVPWAAIPAVRTVAIVQPAADAYLLVEGDRPRDHLPTLFLALAVAVFGVVNLSALARELRR
ncbi:MAG TPA: hypothetical protein VHL80_17315 [Polyangia bacterium]|nr:hypothetical protein [Polyangia bacterium]